MTFSFSFWLKPKWGSTSARTSEPFLAVGDTTTTSPRIAIQFLHETTTPENNLFLYVEDEFGGTVIYEYSLNSAANSSITGVTGSGASKNLFCFYLCSNRTHFILSAMFLKTIKNKFMAFADIFKDSNEYNEKTIIGFMSFAVMVIVMIADVVTGWMGKDLLVNEFIYNSFVFVTLGSFGIAGLEKFAKK
jgi:hypothetical protein